MNSAREIALYGCVWGVLVAGPAHGAQTVYEGLVSVIDATRVRMQSSGLTMRLYGVEGCAAGQRAFYHHIAWPCGAVATGWLTQHTLGAKITCMAIKDAGYAAYAARCFLPDGSDIAAKALTEGMLIGARIGGHLVDPSYAPYENDAKAQRKGLWSSSFQLKDKLFNEVPDE
jgi:endonuclease YncB( thermonuclease family)